MTETVEWQPIETAPHGQIVKLRRTGCEHYDTQGMFTDGKWRLKSFFIDPKTMWMHITPTHWLPLEEVPA